MQDSEIDIFVVDVFLDHRSKVWRSWDEGKCGVGWVMAEIYIVLLIASRLSRNLPQTVRSNYTKPCVKWIIIYAPLFFFLNPLSIFLMVIKHMTFIREWKVLSSLIIIVYEPCDP